MRTNSACSYILTPIIFPIYIDEDEDPDIAVCSKCDCMFQMKHCTTEALVTLLIKSNASSSPPLAFRAVNRVLKYIAEGDITKKSLIKVKPFTLYYMKTTP